MRWWLLAVVGLICGLSFDAVYLRRNSATGPARLPDNPFARLVSATDVGEPVTQADFAVDEPSPPKRLANDSGIPASQTVPTVTTDSPTEQAVRDVIDRFLHDANAEERQIWFDELKGLPAPVVEDLLRVRRQFGMPKPKSHAEYLPPLNPSFAPPAPANTISGRWDETVRALKVARDVHLHNLVNANTIGYRRLVPRFSAQEFHETARGGCRLDTVRLDVLPGELIETGRALDVAIDGPGWLIVQTARGEAYTRSGELVRNGGGALCIRCGEILCPIATCGSKELAASIQLAVIADPTALSYGDDGLLHLAPEAARPERQFPGSIAGTIRTGALERSNVNPDAEWREMELIDRWLQAVK